MVCLIFRQSLGCHEIKMTIILRLQGLDLKASTEDIRTFFSRLYIPDGGVYIVGGSLKEAFIAFTTEKDAQLAMRYTGKILKGSKVTLHLSSIAELEQKLKSLLNKKANSSQKRFTGKRPEPSSDPRSPSLNALPHDHNPGDLPCSTARPLHDPRAANLPRRLYPNTANLQTLPEQSVDSSAAFLLGVCTVLQGLQSSQKQNEALPGADDRVLSDGPETPQLSLNSRPGYVRLFGLPASATKNDICRFFRGLSVKETIVNVKLELGYGCLVKFASMQDAENALHYSQQPFDSVCVEVRTASEKMWTSALQDCKNGNHTEKEMPCDSRKDTINHRQKSSHALHLKRQAVHLLTSKAPKMPRADSVSATSSPTAEYVVMVRNLPKRMTKTDIKELFRCPKVARNNVLHLLDKEGNRTDTAFLIFNCNEDYDYAMNLTGCHVGSVAIEVSPVTKEKMRDIMAKTHPRNIMDHQKDDIKKKQNQKKILSSAIRGTTKTICKSASVPV